MARDPARHKSPKLAIAWEHCWEPNIVKPPQISATGCNRSDDQPPLASAFATMRVGENAWDTAHNPASASRAIQGSSTVTSRNTWRHIPRTQTARVTHPNNNHRSSDCNSAGNSRGSNPLSSTLSSTLRTRSDSLAERVFSLPSRILGGPNVLTLSYRGREHRRRGGEAVVGHAAVDGLRHPLGVVMKVVVAGRCAHIASWFVRNVRRRACRSRQPLADVLGVARRFASHPVAASVVTSCTRGRCEI